MVTIRVSPSDEQVHVNDGDTILSGLYGAGYAYTVGCRRGGCGVCKVDVLEGDIAYCRPVADTVISDEEHAEGTCLSCRAVPSSDLTIRMRDGSLRLVNPLLRQVNQKAHDRAGASGTAPKEL